jgi:hypothetical protein
VITLNRNISVIKATACRCLLNITGFIILVSCGGCGSGDTNPNGGGTVTYAVTPSAGANGSISPATAQTVNSSTSTSFTITPSGGYQIASAGGCNGSLSGTTYTTGAITSACTVTVSFSPTPPSSYTVTATAGTNGSITPVGNIIVTSGQTKNFTVTPNSNYIATVNGCGGILLGSTYTTGVITTACTVTANFSQRFIDKGNGTIYDSANNLTWLKNADCFGGQVWDDAILKSNALASGQCGLSDGSDAGNWRLPTIDELRIFTDAGDYRYDRHDILSAAGFSSVQYGYYWSSSSVSDNSTLAWYVLVYDGSLHAYPKSTDYFHEWPVRTGQ